MTYSRRDLGKIVLGAVPSCAALSRTNSVVNGVPLGVCTYSFRDLPRNNGDALGPVISALKECKAGLCELFSPQLEPENPVFARLMRQATTPGPDGKLPSMQEMSAKFRAAFNSPEAKKYREDLRQWRLTTPMDYFKTVRKRFDDEGIEIYAYTLNFSKDFTHEELEKCFEQTKAMKVKVIASSTQVSMLPRLKPLAEKYKLYVAVHGHSDTKHSDEFSSPATFQTALNMSNWFKVNLDIGHFFAAGFDPVAYIRQHHDRVSHLHMKDRRRHDGPNEPFGKGNTPIKTVLRLLAQRKYAIPALVEYEYRGTGSPVEEVKKCLAYMDDALRTT